MNTEVSNPVLPRPVHNRWHILRAGCVDIWEFDEQEFVFHRGRLILRGRNESGKSKTLELLLPFLLDASLRPERLGAERNASRKMHWNLLNEHNPDRKIRTGYVWVEFGRLDLGEEKTFTVGAGLLARRDGTSSVQAWYLATAKRVGLDFSFTTRSHEVVTRRQLQEILGDDGQIFRSGVDYRRHINAELFGMEEEQYSSLIHTLLELRQPKLSKNLDIKRVGALLAESLPPLDTDLVGRLATDFEELEEHRRDVGDRRRAAQNVKEALKVVRKYAIAVSRKRGDALTSADSRFHRDSANLRESQTLLVAAKAAIERNAQDRNVNDAERRENKAALSTLVESDAYRAVQTIAQRESDAAQLERDVNKATQTAERCDRALAQATEALERQTSCLTEAQKDEEAAWQAAIVPADAIEIDTAAFEAMREAAREWTRRQANQELARGLAAPQAEQAELKRLELECTRQRRHLDTAEQREQETARALAEARMARDERLEALGREEVAFREAATAWFGAMPWSQKANFGPESDLDPEVMERLAEDVAQQEQARLRQRDVALVEERTPVIGERRQATVELEILQSVTHAPPDAPAWRRSRDGAGAPLYLLCDFRDTLSDVEQALVEGALLGSGLLDAWVRPDGRIDEEGSDLWLTPIRPVQGRSLLDILTPVEQDHVPVEVISTLLSSMPLVDDAQIEDGIDLSGGWRSGASVGRNTQQTVRFMGETARERERQRQIHALQEQIIVLTHTIEQIDARRQAIQVALRAVTAHRRSYPSSRALLRAHAGVEEANRSVETRQKEADRASQALMQAQQALQQAVDALHESARRLHRESWLGRLAELALALDELRSRLHDWAAAARDIQAAKGLLRVRQQAHRGEGQRLEAAQSDLRELEMRLKEVRASLLVLRESLGKSPEAILARVETLRVQDRDLEQEHQRLVEARVEAEREEARAKAEVGAADREVQSRHHERDTALTGFRGLVGTGLLRLSIHLAEDSAAKSLTEAIDTARLIAKRHPKIDIGDKAVERAEDRLLERYEKLKSQLPQEFELELGRRQGVAQIIARTGGQSLTLDQLEQRFHSQILEQEKLLEDEERRVLAEFLTGATRRHLRERLVRAQELIDRANHVLRQCPTPQGTQIRLKWTLDNDAPAAAENAVRILRLDSDMQTTADRRTLRDFLQDRLTQARAEEGSLKERMLELLDYRRWHRFDLETTKPGQPGWRRLTSKVHGAGSGGQKAVLLHLPLFAAASAFYDSASARSPRLVLMDEAFAGVDTPMRAELLGLLCKLELDFVLTSYSEWGCYATVDGTAIYNLSREKGISGVLAERYVWDGTVREAFGDRR